MRLFVAVEPPPELAAALARRIERQRGGLPPARWLRPDQLHLTLLFLGETDAARVSDLDAALAAALAERRRFAARLAGAGGFPEHGPVRVVWAGLEPAAELAALAQAARGAVASCGLGFDDKPFRAHLTLARCPTPWPAAARARLAGWLGPLEGEALPVDRVALVESTLAPGGARYRTVAERPLGEAA